MSKNDWKINIENMISRVDEKYDFQISDALLRKYGAICFDDLNPSYYSEVFGDLMQMDEDY